MKIFKKPIIIAQLVVIIILMEVIKTLLIIIIILMEIIKEVQIIITLMDIITNNKKMMKKLKK